MSLQSVKEAERVRKDFLIETLLEDRRRLEWLMKKHGTTRYEIGHQMKKENNDDPVSDR